jgi:hypothetical protein
LARADNWVDIVGTNKAGQTVIVSFDGKTDGHAFIMFQTRSGESSSYDDEPCERASSASVRARMKACEAAAQKACEFPPGTDLGPVQLTCSRKGTSPLAGVTYRVIRVNNDKTCVANRYVCTRGCRSKYVPAVMEQGIDECGT